MTMPAISPVPRSRPPRLSAVVADRIVEDLFARGLRPGDRLPTEAELARRHEVSRTVVREAGRILDQRGIVDIRPGRGMVVAVPDATVVTSHYELMLRMNTATFGQLMQARLLIEVEVAALAARNRTEDDLVELGATIDASRAGPHDYDTSLDADLRFHRLISRASRNPFVAMLMDPVNECLRLACGDTRGHLAGQTDTLDEHAAILAAVRDRDADAARQATRAHLDRVAGAADSLVVRDTGR
ncbi:DNA-binding FadR family transcriptional regulator [Actinoalloteichus hoggarensis]|uniref:HTH-type transcriptional regulator LutR n=1 Tax=Actinoalloteichus hoggarensis TaxID=1470176 RepID=A0A221W3S7_9PSEU|nr:FadR/GntR family transcriptional regulator [Actinoalloteichus hoggarensis]ASO20522.1 HTH-type transcriptional regulator LutR [Actinoalloteichus hoggarensis]MBB5923562.1 DNA-binding FadR family transcriptional regulator [Actinoalloteichus hoggarensis]